MNKEIQEPIILSETFITDDGDCMRLMVGMNGLFIQHDKFNDEYQHVDEFNMMSLTLEELDYIKEFGYKFQREVKLIQLLNGKSK